MQKISITWDFAGFTFEVSDKSFATDYCGFPRDCEIEVIKNLLEYLGHTVEVVEITDDEDDEST